MMKSTLRFMSVIFGINIFVGWFIIGDYEPIWQILRNAIWFSLASGLLFIVLAVMVKIIAIKSIQVLVILALPFGYALGIWFFDLYCGNFITECKLQTYLIGIFQLAFLTLCQLDYLGKSSS